MLDADVSNRAKNRTFAWLFGKQIFFGAQGYAPDGVAIVGDAPPVRCDLWFLSIIYFQQIYCYNCTLFFEMNRVIIK